MPKLLIRKSVANGPRSISQLTAEERRERIIALKKRIEANLAVKAREVQGATSRRYSTPQKPRRGRPPKRTAAPKKLPVYYDDEYSQEWSYSDEDSEQNSEELEEFSDEEDIPKELKARRKTYVTAGIYSKSKAGPGRKQRRFKVKLPEEITPKPFKIPYSIYCPSPNRVTNMKDFKIIKRNVYVSYSRSDLINALSSNYGNTECVCDDTNPCDDSCLNRIMQVECVSANCGYERLTGKHCNNRQFATLAKLLSAQKRYATGFEVVSTGEKGYGLRATRSYKPHELIVEYIGEVLDQDEVAERLRDSSRLKQLGPSHFYFLSLEKGLSIDSKRRGSLARFVNHSCSPNSEMQKWYISGEPRIGLFAGRDGVRAGDEITYDYNFDWFPSAEPQRCLCGSPQCRGFIGKKSGVKFTPPSSVTPPNEPRSKKRKCPSQKDSGKLKKRFMQEATPPSSPDTDGTASKLNRKKRATTVMPPRAKRKYTKRHPTQQPVTKRNYIEKLSVEPPLRKYTKRQPAKPEIKRKYTKRIIERVDLPRQKSQVTRQVKPNEDNKPAHTKRQYTKRTKAEPEPENQEPKPVTRASRRLKDAVPDLSEAMPRSLMRSLRIDMAPPGKVVDDITRELVKISQTASHSDSGIPERVTKRVKKDLKEATSTRTPSKKREREAVLKTLPVTSRTKDDEYNKVSDMLFKKLARREPGRLELNRLSIDDKPPLIIPRGHRQTRKPINYQE